jgi:hypothetical protein
VKRFTNSEETVSVFIVTHVCRQAEGLVVDLMTVISIEPRGRYDEAMALFGRISAAYAGVPLADWEAIDDGGKGKVL